MLPASISFEMTDAVSAQAMREHWLSLGRRLARLPHRRVNVDFTPSGVVFQTATERLELAWSEVAAITGLPGFWLLRLKSGAEIPVPRALLSPGLLAAMHAAGSPTVTLG